MQACVCMHVCMYTHMHTQGQASGWRGLLTVWGFLPPLVVFRSMSLCTSVCLGHLVLSVVIMGVTLLSLLPAEERTAGSQGHP